MKRLTSVLLFVLIVSTAAYPWSNRARSENNASTSPAGLQTSDPAITATRAVGEVTKIDAAGKQVILKTEAASVVIVNLDDKTEFLRVPPGETSLDKALPTTLAEISVGDKVYARGRVSEDRKSVPAQKLIVMAKADISKKNEKERAEWRKRGVSGLITKLDAQAHEITLQVSGREGQKSVIVTAPDSIPQRRYAADSVKFSDAKPSSFAELKVGDQLRALGEKSADGTRLTAEQIVSGAFRTIGGTVKSVSPESNEIKIEMLGTKQMFTVVVNHDSMLRRLPQQVAMFLAMRSQGGAPGAPGQPAPAGGAPRPAAPPNAGAPGGPPARPEGGGDFQDMLERLQPLTLAEIKPGDVIAVSSTVGSDPSRLTAITLVTGIDMVLAAMQMSGAARRTPNLSTGLPSGVLDLGMGLP